MGGKLNSGTESDPDYITDVTEDLNFLYGDYELDTFAVSRSNEDHLINYLAFNC